MQHSFDHYLERIGEFGIAEKIHHPLVQAQGLPCAKPTEIVVFETGQIGEVMSINKDSLEILVFSKEPVQGGTKIARTNTPMSVPIGHELLGAAIDPLGVPLDPTIDFIKPKQRREVDTEPLSISVRQKVTQPLETGVTLVDIMIPIGKGQRELVIGDRKTGKSSFLFSVIKNQVNLSKMGRGSVCIYAAIGKKQSDIKKLAEIFQKNGIVEKTILVATNSYDSPSLIHLTPYTAMTIAEYFRDQGEDVLVILDDLSTHAKFYREISLIARRFPGRDSYPGDIFYAHAKLLERAGCFSHKKGTVAITCLPVVETVASDFTGYIQTNLMGMTDGHIYFDSNVFYKGQRPAINIPLSVTRAGKQTQSKLKRELNRELAAFLFRYEKLLNLSHFGAELTDEVKQVLKIGEMFNRFFSQSYTQTIPEEIQVILFGVIWGNILSEPTDVDAVRTSLSENFGKPIYNKLYKEIISAETIPNLIKNIEKHKGKVLWKKKSGS